LSFANQVQHDLDIGILGLRHNNGGVLQVRIGSVFQNLENKIDINMFTPFGKVSQEAKIHIFTDLCYKLKEFPLTKELTVV
jgi:hypothetical protein